MTDLQHIELEILQVLDALSLRPTLEKVVRIGRKLAEAKELLPRGSWLPFVRRIGLHPRSAQLYVQVAEAGPDTEHRMTLERFLQEMRAAKRSLTKELVAELRANATGQQQRGKVRLVRADCKTYRWPVSVGMVCTDPPWGDLAAYRWLAGFTARKLRDGGLALVQCGAESLPEVASYFTGEGLRYVWTLAIVFDELSANGLQVRAGMNQCWRAVMLLSAGDYQRPLSIMSDTYSVRGFQKLHHIHEQPLAPFKYWLERLARPGWLIADPFAGSGTVGVACKQIGDLSYIGTEFDRTVCKIAQDRLAR
jgi:hypothetical protein